MWLCGRVSAVMCLCAYQRQMNISTKNDYIINLHWTPATRESC